jgi:hypothetical protein
VSLDERADCIVELTLPEPIAGDRLIPLIAPIRRFGAKPVAFEGAAAEEQPTHLPGWTPLLPGVRFDRVRAGLLLANRHGPVNAMEFADFAGAVQTLADQLGAGLSSVQMASVLERARDLDSLCMQLDAQVGLNVEGPEPLSVGDLERLAVEQQLVERGNNRFARFNARDGLLFTLSLADEPGRLTLLLDVPRAPAADRPWDQLVACAHLLADRLDGQIVDDAGRKLADAALERIGSQLEQRYDSLARAGFPAGSPVALRLFN